MKNKFKIIGFILIFIALFLIAFGFVLGLLNKEGSNGDNDKNKDFNYVVKNTYQRYSIDEQIALILVSDYIKEQASIENLRQVSYDDNKFVLEYVLKRSEGGRDTLRIETTDFVSYDYHTVTYENQDPIYNDISGYDSILSTSREMVYTLASDNGYVVGYVLTKKEILGVLDILKNNELKSNIDLIEKNGYELKSYSGIKNDNIYYIYRSKDGGYLKVYCSFDNSGVWNIYGSDKKKLNDEYTLYDTENVYLIDRSFTINDNAHKDIKRIIKDYLKD